MVFQPNIRSRLLIKEQWFNLPILQTITWSLVLVSCNCMELAIMNDSLYAVTQFFPIVPYLAFTVKVMVCWIMLNRWVVTTTEFLQSLPELLLCNLYRVNLVESTVFKSFCLLHMQAYVRQSKGFSLMSCDPSYLGITRTA